MIDRTFQLLPPVDLAGFHTNPGNLKSPKVEISVPDDAVLYLQILEDLKLVQPWKMSGALKLEFDMRIPTSSMQVGQ